MIPTNKKVVTEQTIQNTNITNLQDNKVDKVSGKALSTNDFTNAYKTKIDNMFSLIYPVGSIYMSVNSTNPASLFGGTWEAIGGRFLLGADTTYSAGSTGGEKTHTLTINEMPSHSHGIRTSSIDGGMDWVPKDHQGNVNVSELNFNWEGTVISTTGGGQPHNNMPPYLAVYMWKRTA